MDLGLAYTKTSSDSSTHSQSSSTGRDLQQTSIEPAGLGQSAAASPVSIALTVLEKQLTRVTVSGASSCSYTCMNCSLLDELILENSYTHVSRHVRKFYDTGDGSAYCSSIPSMFISFTCAACRFRRKCH